MAHTSQLLTLDHEYERNLKDVSSSEYEIGTLMILSGRRGRCIAGWKPEEPAPGASYLTGFAQAGAASDHALQLCSLEPNLGQAINAVTGARLGLLVVLFQGPVSFGRCCIA
jgi:hypothetical protein